MPYRARLSLVVAMVLGSLALVRIATTGSASVVLPPDGQVARGDSLLGTFEGRTPCGMIATEFTGFPARNCEKVKWRLTLYRNPADRRPSSYRYQGTRTTRHGHWRIEAPGGSGRARTVYHLTPTGPGGPLSLLSIDDKVLLLLDENGQVLVGDASWSYTLNRIDSPSRIRPPN